MTGPAERLRTRLLPALLTALGVTLLAAGLLTYSDSVAAEPGATPSPSPTIAAVATPSPLITLPPLVTTGPTASPTPSPSADPNRVATRVRIVALGIDMPVVKGPTGYPYCDVAMYLVYPGIGQPGQGRATYLFAHARTGMFLPLLETKGNDQRGSRVEVWTSDDHKFVYEIVDVRRGQTTLNDAVAADSEELWLQTSEGVKGTPGKTQVIAKPISEELADPAEAHPKAHPVDCE
jgi:sortase (surface protein transpeptidase)